MMESHAKILWNRFDQPVRCYRLSKVSDTITAGLRFVEIESVKAASDMYPGLSGTVTAVNDALSGDPGLVHRDPYPDQE